MPERYKDFHVGSTIRRKHLLEQSTYTPKSKTYPAQHIDIEIISSDTCIRLSELLPPGWKFVESFGLIELQCRGRCDFGAQTVYLFDGMTEEVAATYIGRDGTIATILHEIGHAIDMTSASSEEREDLLRLDAIADSFNRGRVRDLSDEEKGVLRRCVMRSERNASAHALHMVRLLRSRGIDPEPHWSAGDFRKDVESNLEEYRKALRKLNIHFDEREGRHG